MEIAHIELLAYILEIIVFLILMVIFRFVFKKLKNTSNKLFDLKEYFPEEEIHTLRQIFYLIMMGLLFVDIIYSIVYVEDDLLLFVIFDILLSLYISSKIDKNSLKNKIILLLIIPYGSLNYILFNNSLIGIMDIIHVPALMYFIKIYYDKFREYTKSNGLGMSILLLFTIIFISFFITQLAEHVTPLNAINMVSNAFTSNGYAVLGSTSIGKLNSIFLVWGGYLLSSVGTATLAAGILKRYQDSKNEELHERIDELNEKIDNLEDLIKNKD
ncbi:hypothetical protein [Methanobrevibacter sp.]|uniref:hypothetical protein n=1 Tax=Methanobrevibacter sp. TaxID=66852 RepID=UPI003890A175